MLLRNANTSWCRCFEDRFTSDKDFHILCKFVVCTEVVISAHLLLLKLPSGSFCVINNRVFHSISLAYIWVGQTLKIFYCSEIGDCITLFADSINCCSWLLYKWWWIWSINLTRVSSVEKRFPLFYDPQESSMNFYFPMCPLNHATTGIYIDFDSMKNQMFNMCGERRANGNQNQQTTSVKRTYFYDIRVLAHQNFSFKNK